jgi:hypothetical protein
LPSAPRLGHLPEFRKVRDAVNTRRYPTTTSVYSPSFASHIWRSRNSIPLREERLSSRLPSTWRCVSAAGCSAASPPCRFQHGTQRGHVLTDRIRRTGHVERYAMLEMPGSYPARRDRRLMRMSSPGDERRVGAAVHYRERVRKHTQCHEKSKGC